MVGGPRAKTALTVIFLLLSSAQISCSVVWAKNSAPSDVSGEIDVGIFGQLPSTLIVGEIYSLFVRVTNTGAVPASYEIELRAHILTYSFEILPKERLAFSLAPGNSTTLKFQLIPLIPSDRPTEISAKLFIESPILTGPVSSVTKTIRKIKLSDNQPIIVALLALGAISATVAILVFYARSRKYRKHLLISIALFSIAILLRCYNYMRVAAYQDELIFANYGLNIIANGWTWPTSMMNDPAYPPIFLYLNATAQYLFGYELDHVRWVSIIAGSLTPVVLYLLGSSMYDERTGLLAGVAGVFWAEFIVYSDIIRAESLMLLLILLSVYLLWRGERGGRFRWYLASGFVMGLACDIKYVAFAYVAGVLLYFVLRGRSLKALLRKGPLLWSGSFLALIGPVQLVLMANGANPYYYYFYNTLEPALGWVKILGMEVGSPATPKGIFDYVFKYFVAYTYETTRSGNPWLPWLSIVVVAECILLVVVPTIYLYETLRGRRSDSYLFLLFVSLIPVLPFSAHTDWLIYTIPFFLLMCSRFTVDSVRALRQFTVGSPNFRNLQQYLRMLLLVALIIFLTSQGVIGALTPLSDRGEYDGVRIAATYIDRNAAPGAIVALDPLIAYSFHYWAQRNRMNLTLLSIRLPADVATLLAGTEFGALSRSRHEQFVLRGAWVVPAYIVVLQPDYIAVTRRTLLFGLNATMKSWIYSHYKEVSIAGPQVGYKWWTPWGMHVASGVGIIVVLKKL